MTKSKKAQNYYKEGFNCAQSVIVTFADTLNITEETALKIASGFGGGMGSMQQTCGAVTGAFMVIGFLRGKYQKGDDKAKEVTNKLIQQFSKEFAEKHGSINCKTLIKHDISTEQGMQDAKNEDVFNKKCTLFIKEAVSLLEEIMESKELK